tara:strand:- start:230 stop:412 length:183 start_codon:yes stop_codon:yes gene_type:complete
MSFLNINGNEAIPIIKSEMIIRKLTMIFLKIDLGFLLIKLNLDGEFKNYIAKYLIYRQFL